MNLSFHPEADEEFQRAVEYYEAGQSGLGQDFYLEVERTMERIARFPQAWPILRGGVRRCLVHRFPYGVLYHADEEEILILAVMHLRRDPGYWRHRSR